MTEDQMVVALRSMSDERDSDALRTYLAIAGSKIVQRMYPFGSDKTEVPEKYHYTQLEIALYLLNKRGADYQTAHDENGIKRTYGSADVPAELLRTITPMASVIGGKR